MQNLFPGQYKPTATHYFLTLLHAKGLLLRVASQNIDSLETAAGLPRHMVVPAHGNFDGGCRGLGACWGAPEPTAPTQAGAWAPAGARLSPPPRPEPPRVFPPGAHCIKCDRDVEVAAIKAAVDAGDVAKCSHCG